MDRRSLYFTAPRRAELRREAVPQPGAAEVLVETILSAISPGTEMLVYRGQTPAEMSVDATIGALGGNFGFPIKYGYAAVGRVAALGPDVDGAWLGRLVFAFNPHETHFIAPVASLHPLPDGMPPERAVFLPNVETAASFVMDGRPVIGERVAVVGQGVVGLLTTALLGAFPLTGLLAVDPLASRREWALRLGATAAHQPDEARQAWGEVAGDLTGEAGGADLTYELSGNPQALDLAIALTGDHGRIVVGSWYGTKPMQVDLGGRFHRGHMRLISTQVSALSARWLGRWSKARRLAVAWQMLPRLRPERLITHRLSFDDAPEAYRLLDESPDEAIQIVFTYL